MNSILKPKKGLKLSIKWKFTFIFTTLMIGLVILLTWTHISTQKKIMYRNLDRRIHLMRSNLIETGKILMTNLLINVEKDMAVLNFSGAFESIQTVIDTNKAVKASILMDKKRTAILHSEKNTLVNTVLEDDISKQVAKLKGIHVFQYQQYNIEIVSHVQFSSVPWGHLRIILDLQPLVHEINESESQIQNEIHSIKKRTIINTLFFIIISFMLVYYICLRITKKIIMLTHSAELISKGNFSIQIKESSTNDEISILQRSFRIMASNLKSLITRLNNYNKKLESVVEERTMELKISEQKYKGLYNSSKDGIFYLDMENTFENANFAFIELTGYSSRELKKMKLEDLEEKKSDKIKEVLNEIKQKGFSHEIEVNILHKSGSIIPVAIHAWLLKNNTGTSEGIWGFGRDISERKFAENIREDVERMIRHDIKSPLNGIIGLSNIILEHDTIDDANIKNLESIIELSLNTIQLIENSLKMHRIESGNYQLEAEDCDLISMLLKYKTEYSLMIKEKIIGLEYFYENKNFYEDSNITCFVRGEKILLNLLFGNLLKNAIEASPKNETITINIIQTDNEIRININNQGVIPKSIRPKFFEKYTSSGKKNGTGLGTFSSKLIAKVHKGDITFETSPTKGTTLIVSLPASNIEKIIDSQSIENDILEKDPNNSNLFLRNQRLNVLVVDDSTTNRFIMKQAIQSLTKWIPYFAVNGQEAITSFQSHSIDVVLMDMYMPDYNGDVAIQKIREIEKGNNHINRVCIIVISADTTNWIEGADGYVSKSFNSIDQFIDDIIRIINLGVSQKN